jgi:uncharacterized repeat protein (TIGR01451 family)
MSVKTPVLTLAVLCVSLLLVLLGVVAAPAMAEGVGPQWTIAVVSAPTNIDPGAVPGEDHYTVDLTNTGSAPSSGPVTLTDVLPAGLSLDVAGASGYNPLGAGGNQGGTGFSCALASCTYAPSVAPDQTLVFTFPLDVTAAEGAALTDVVRVSGGGALAAHVEIPTVVSVQPASFGIPQGAATTALSTLQAGAHPDITNSYAFSSIDAEGFLAGDPKDVVYVLPPGFAADFADTPVCSAAQFAATACPIDSQVGVTTVHITSQRGGLNTFVEPVYNVAPDPGHLAALGFEVAGNFAIVGEISLQPRRDAAEVTFANIDDALADISGGSLTVWGDPASPVHDPLRAIPGALPSFGVSSSATPAPYFTSPTSCGSEPLHSEFRVDSWEQPGVFETAQTPYGPVVDCDRLTIEPKLEVQASSSSAETATGLDVNLEVPQHYENPESDVASNLADARVVLPVGMTVNPSAGAGLAGCTEAEFAYEGGVLEPEAGRGCPSESKLGSAHARSPGVPEEEEATGSLFLAKPYENKFGSLIAIYLVLRIPKRGVVVTAPGRVELNPETGQITTIFNEDPQLPVSDFVFTFHQGATSPLVTPPACGTYTSEGDFIPWSVPLQEHVLASQFEITSGVNGGGCPSGGTPPFAPKVISGTQDNDAGGYSPFYLRIIREDGEQELTRFSTVFPPGITGKLAGIPLCPQADIEAARHVTGTEELEHPSCPAASEIGHTVVSAGVGTVLAQASGKVYLAGAYHGAGLSVVSITAAKVGPFDLGTVVIQFTLRINQTTAQVEVDGETSDAIPHIIDGIVVHVREIRAYIAREQFIINPTNCDPLGISDTITGAGADYAIPADQVPVTVASPFQAADCSSLQFKPVFKASTSAHTSRIDGASLHVTLALPEEQGPGKEANVARVKVSLPKQLPSPLKTLQKACTEKVFGENPGNCPVSSRVGEVKVSTPILANPLTGPAYFVSHGGAKYPELIMVLSGENGIQVDVHGETFISKQGITSATFSTVPDVPFSEFELTFPEREYPALTANGNLCKGSLIMPTEMVGQNGLVLHQSTKISVTGCPKAKKASHKKKRRGKHRAHGKKKR